MKMKRFVRVARRLAGLTILTLTTALVGCNGGGSSSDSGGDTGGGGGDTTTGGVVIQGAEGDAIALPADPEQIVAIDANLDLSNTVSYDSESGIATVHFFFTDENGNGISLTKNPVELRFYVSELASDPSAVDNPGLAWNQLLSERGTPGDADSSQLPGTLTVIDGNAGEYSYQLAEAIPQTGNVVRITARARWRETIDGSRYYVINSVNSSYDFLQGDAGSELAASGADMVDTQACDSCHGVRIGGVGHGGGYTEVKTCNNCHNVNYMSEANGRSPEADLAHMVHRIHAGGQFETLDRGGPADFSHVAYPQELSSCTKCHNDNAPNADLAFTNPTRKNCGSCHANVDFDTGENHPGGVFQDDTLCSACHQKNGSSIDGGIPGNDHKSMIAGSELVPEPQNVAEFDVSITMEAPANGMYYVAGETPLVTVRLTPQDGGPVVDYTAAADDKGDRDGMLSGANLYVYGPRAHALPVLTTNSTTDGGKQQGHALFAGGSDPQVMTDASGFKYELMDNIGDLQPGTYMVRFEGGDYGAISDEDYHTASVGLINFQVGQNEEEPKVAGDACTSCHGDTRMHVEGAHPHNQPFNTDGCLGCHDFSNNYGNYIGNRVHAVHSNSETGDLGPGGHYDWSHVSYPQDAENCYTCHTNPDADPPVWRKVVPTACAGCHGADPMASDEGEAIAASHMILMGADFSTDDAEPGCLVCHGTGKDMDLFDEHDLKHYDYPAN